MHSKISTSWEYDSKIRAFGEKNQTVKISTYLKAVLKNIMELWAVEMSPPAFVADFAVFPPLRKRRNFSGNIGPARFVWKRAGLAAENLAEKLLQSCFPWSKIKIGNIIAGRPGSVDSTPQPCTSEHSTQHSDLFIAPRAYYTRILLQ